MDFKKDAKEGTCPMCSSPTKKATANQDGIDYPVRICTGCGWNG
jgi:RNase P subunit RPR2